MMTLPPKATIVPLHFGTSTDAAFHAQIQSLALLFRDEAEILPPQSLGSQLPPVDAVLLPQVLGDAYRDRELLRQIDKPILIITSEFGTVSMWDWEIRSYLRREGIRTIAPYNSALARVVLRALAARRILRQSRFVVYQDNPGEGFQAGIFKRFFWWEDECAERMKSRFGIQIEKRSFRDLGARAKEIPASEADQALESRNVSTTELAPGALRSAARLYLALKREIGGDPSIAGVGINCLNESHFSDTTPCLAWSLLYEEQDLIWGCEADVVAMLSKHILHKSLRSPIMMTNMYPFLLGQAALKHERISEFPQVSEPENCVLVAHCGFLGVLPRPFAAEWTLRSKVLGIVDENASAIDARLPEGPITLAKLTPGMDSFSVAEGQLESYAQYPGSDCRNGAVLRLKDGHRFMEELCSHHYLLMTGHQRAGIEFLSQIFDLTVQPM